MIAVMVTGIDQVPTSSVAGTYEAANRVVRGGCPQALARRIAGEPLAPRPAGSGCGLSLLLPRLPAPREQLVEPLGRVGGDAREQVAQVGLRIEAVELGGLDQGVDRRRPQAAVIGAGEQPVLAAERDGPDRPLGGVVVDLQTAV